MKFQYNISVIVTVHNYGKYLPQSLGSLFSQRYQSFEVIVVNDGSTDNTAEVLDHFKKKHPEKLKIITLTGAGLAKACNVGIKLSTGKYIIRLDADDYFDENILLIESNILDNDPHIHMVYPDYYLIDKYGEITDSCRQLKVNDEIKLLDRSPLAAGALFRRECYDAIGGYNEELRYQEDYDFWIRFIDKFNVMNVNLPLMYYRRHNNNMSNNFEERMNARQYVKEKFVKEKGYRHDLNIIAVIPAMGFFRDSEKLAMRALSGKPVIAYTIEEALKTELIDRVIVSTEDSEIAELSIAHGAEVPFLRPPELSKRSVPVDDVLRHMLKRFQCRGDKKPDIIVILPYISIFREEKHITEAIDTILLYDTDSVISVMLDVTFHWKPGKYGLIPVGYRKRLLREDRETIYKENGSLYVVRTKNLEKNCFLGKKVGHIEMSMKSAWRIESDFDFFVAKQIIEERKLLTESQKYAIH